MNDNKIEIDELIKGIGKKFSILERKRG